MPLFVILRQSWNLSYQDVSGSGCIKTKQKSQRYSKEKPIKL